MFNQIYLLKNPITSKFIYLVSVLSIATVFANPANGVQIKYGSPGNVSKIEDLVVDDIGYDITFKYDSFINLFGSPNNSDFQKPTFWDNPQGAKNLVDSIASLLNFQQTVPTQINNYPSALVPYRGAVAPNGTLFLVSKVDSYITRWDNYRGESQDIFTRGNEQANYAIVNINQSSDAVPEGNMLATVMAGFFFVVGMKMQRKMAKLNQQNK
ncbi:MULTISPECIES: hypothetical protein [unclassified Tolypothrix]|uniref:hypothetical protein n=1 Tax=unclassified Tolypothrix TaxID=2649714 RepID=UPI0005EAC6A5|nr:MULTISPECIES: hypothetical protein [unclassified Tolypothrix]BAY94731.1 hypothetical protein NIES3275_67830 [Microchaete diplosiphon NIES-3275]EKE99035.1 hypothetical protein FDUTEX481_03226 [Tolypothrix sp. PCC 7601]MBE9081360.1 hypothetical protein [Tolypothrix sp. LEGE 11397]UYD28420.1 hypothetical protein HGR01_10470 [Tolypothrix sp. PCC 7712]UYD35701.1 hypothetical protein HG267_08090 [Tolypothrix sp. PCC 7601]